MKYISKLHGISPAFWCGLVFVFLFSVQFVKVTRILPLDQMLQPWPIAQENYLRAYTAILRDDAFLRASGKSSGYNPFVSAGKLDGLQYDTENRAVTLFARLTGPRIQPGTVLKILTFAIFLLAPLCLYFSMKIVAANEISALSAYALGIVGFCYSDPQSYVMVDQGNIGFMASAYLAVLAMAFFYQMINGSRIRDFVGFSVSFSLAGIFHLGGVVVLNLAMIVLLLMEIRQITRRTWLFLGIGFSVFFLVNCFWLQRLSVVDAFGPYLREEIHPAMDVVRLYFPLRQNAFRYVQAFIRGTILLIAIGGAFDLLLSENRKWGIGFLIVGAASLLISIFGMFPFTFFAPLLFALPAAHFIRKHVAIPGTRQFLMLSWVGWFLLTWQLPVQGALPRLTVRRLAGMETLAEYLTNLKPSGRILLENADLPLAELMPYVTGHEYVGFSMRKNEQNLPLLGGRELLAHTPVTLLRTFDRYSITHIVAFSPLGRAYFNQFPRLLKPVTIDSDNRNAEWFNIFVVQANTADRLFRGGGKVTSNFNRIEIENLTGVNPILKYRWVDNLKTDVGGGVQSVVVSSDTVSFIEMKGSTHPSKIVIYH